jgi:hypothetical protein
MAAESNFNVSHPTKDVALAAVQVWSGSFRQKIGRLKNDSSQLRRIKSADSIARQTIDSLQTSRHGFILKAEKNDQPCALLVADETPKEIVIRFLVADVINPEAKGSGTLLVQKIVEIAQKTNRFVRTTPENSAKYWKNQGFSEDPLNAATYI